MTKDHTFNDAQSGVMRAAENAAKTVEGWSASKREYADRVTGASQPSPAATVETNLAVNGPGVAERIGMELDRHCSAGNEGYVRGYNDGVAFAARSTPVEPQSVQVDLLRELYEWCRGCNDFRIDSNLSRRIQSALRGPAFPQSEGGR